MSHAGTIFYLFVINGLKSHFNQISTYDRKGAAAIESDGGTDVT
jgi:hypothetical protein